MSDKILITTADGNVGSHVLAQLRQQNVDVVAGVFEETIDGVESRKMDFANPESLESALEGISKVLMVIPTDPDMVQWGKNFLAAANKSDVTHIVRLSTSLARKDASLKAPGLLGATDNDLRACGIDYTIVAPQFFMQNFFNFYGNDYNNGTIYLPAADGKIGWVDTNDIAAVIAAALQEPEKYKSQTLTITGRENLSYADAVSTMNEVLGKQSQYVAVSDDAAVEAMTNMQFPPFIVDFMLSLNQAVVKGHAEEVTDTVEKVLGRQPVTFKQFVENNAERWAS